MPVHDVDMDDVGMVLDELDLVGRVCGVVDKIGAAASPRASCYPSRQSRLPNAATNMPSPPCRWGHTRSPGGLRLWAVDRDRLEVGAMTDDSVGGRVGLGSRERADGVDQPAPYEEVGERRHDLDLGPR